MSYVIDAAAAAADDAGTVVTTATFRQDIPELYQAALIRRWNIVASRAQSHPEEARYADPSDGLTALHLAVISRTTPTDVSYRRGGKTSARLRDSSGAEVAGTRRIKVPAPMSSVRALLVANPDATIARCRSNGYTPLAYACHVPPPDKEAQMAEDMGDAGTVYTGYTGFTAGTRATVYQSVFRDSYGILDECEKLVRLILTYRPDSASVLSKDGLSALDLHIMSYSVGWGIEHDNESAGRTNTGVLRTLLEENPSLACSRPREEQDQLGSSSAIGSSTSSTDTIGPLEILYKYNATRFIKVLQGQDETPRSGGADDEGAASRSVRRAKRAWYEEVAGTPSSTATRQTLSSWWVWKWSILLLKYLHHKRGSKFQAVHSASSSPGCPLPLLMLAIRAFPNQIREADEHSGNGNLPLHMVASWGIPPSRREEQEDARAAARYVASLDPIAQRTKAMVLSELLTEYPDAARVRSKRGKTPLALLVEAGGTWFHGGVRRMVRAYPEALNIRDRKTGLMPFMTAATACRRSNAKPGSYSDLKVLTTIFELLRNEPRAVRPSSRSRKKKKRSETKQR
mmetsp:Transcript_29706/g.86571  ORF Transcript_29706/g.86571 Transcript_29706/m.86571 type:complete len:571 (-) Transcript_29706:1639-3351(-)